MTSKTITPITSQSQLIIFHAPDGGAQVALYAKDGDVWLNQKQLAELFATSVPNINTHILNILNDKELLENSVIKDYLITAADGKNYQVAFYSLAMIMAIGFRVRSQRGVQFRQWANSTLQEYMQKGFVIDAERLKNPDGRLDYFDELLEQIRDIRASEKRFYQKVRDLFALCSDYDPSDKATQMFFAETQNKLLFATTGLTAAEIVVKRIDANQANAGLNSWQGKVVRKADVIIAKNYLTHDEIDTLNRLVVIFLETAELRAKNRQQILMSFWQERIDKLLIDNGFSVLDHRGSVSKQQMEQHADQVYLAFNQRRKVAQAEAADREDELLVSTQELEQLEQQIKTKRKKK